MLNVIKIIAFRIGMFILLLIASPLWIIFGIVCAFSSLFGMFDEYRFMNVYESFDREISPMVDADEKISDDYNV